MSGSVSLVNGHIDSDKNEMTPQEALAWVEDYEKAIKEEQAIVNNGDEFHVEALKVCEVVKQALEKQIPKNHFINECECIVDYEILYNAIDNKCKTLNCYFHNEYRIVLRNNYPAVCINRQWFYVHILVCEFVSGRVRKGCIVHHKDKNKLNATLENLEIMTNRKHLKQHGQERKGIDFRSAEGRANSTNSAREVRTRKDVTVERVAELRNKGLTIPEIAKEFNCGINTVNRRLGMKDY